MIDVIIEDSNMKIEVNENLYLHQHLITEKEMQWNVFCCVWGWAKGRPKV